MKKHFKITELALLFGSLLLLSSFAGCEANIYVTESKTSIIPKPACVLSQTFNPNVELDYMFGYTPDSSEYVTWCEPFTLANDHGALFKQAFQRASCTITLYPEFGTQNPAYNFDTILTVDALVLYIDDVYKPVYYNHLDITNNPLDSAYLLSINTAASLAQIGGVTSTSRHFSVLLAGNIYNSYRNFMGKAMQKLATHEMGHQIGQYDEGGDTVCMGRFSLDTCVMYQNHYIEGDPIMELCRFCDIHTCPMYQRFALYNNAGTVLTSPMSHMASIQSGNFSITFSTTKTDYLQLEPVWSTITITNNGSVLDSVEIHNQYDFLENVTLTNTEGSRFPYTYITGDYLTPNYIKLNSGESVSFDQELSICFAKNRVKGFNYQPSQYFSESSYSGLGWYAINKNKVISTEINFNIKQPQNDELEIFNQIMSLCQAGKQNKDLSNSFLELYNSHKNSVYAEELFKNYVDMNRYFGLYDEAFIDNSKTFFDMYPNTLYMKDLLNNCIIGVTRVRKSNKAGADFLRELIAKHPNSKVQHEADFNLRNNKFVK